MRPETESGAVPVPPAAFSHRDYRDALREWAKSLPKGARGAKARLARALSISPSHLSQVLSKKRRLSPSQAFELGKAMGLPREQCEYLGLLATLEECPSGGFKKQIELRLQAMRVENLSARKSISPCRDLSPAERRAFHSSWINPAVHLYCQTSPTGRTREEISRRFHLPRRALDRSLAFLTGIHLLAARGRHFHALEANTHLAPGLEETREMHKNWRLKASAKSEHLTDHELMFSALASISRENFSNAREILSRAVREVCTLAKSSPPEEVVHLAVDLFYAD